MDILDNLERRFQEGLMGEITQWDAKRGFGFIRVAEANADVFFRHNVFIAQNIAPKVGNSVIVCAEKDGFSWQATSVFVPDWTELDAPVIAPKPAAPPDSRLRQRLQKGMRGSVRTWDETRGIGILHTQHPPLDIFFDVAAWANRHRAPEVGEAVYLSAAFDQQTWKAWAVTPVTDVGYFGRWQAQLASLYQPMFPHVWLATALIFLWFTILAGAQWQLGGFYLVWSGAVFVLYAWDKYCATEHLPRVAEIWLYACNILGGWAGALLARYVLGHRVEVSSFSMIFWLSALLNAAISLYLIELRSAYLQRLFS